MDASVCAGPKRTIAYLSDVGGVKCCGRGLHGHGVVGSVDALPYLGPRLPRLAAGDEMVDRSFLAERLRPLGLWWVATGVVGTTIAAGAGQKLGGDASLMCGLDRSE